MQFPWEQNSKTENASFADALGNQLSGNLDYQRDLELLSKQQKFNALEAQKARDYEKMMSDTAVQRAAADYAAAGFNPALALNSSASSFNAPAASSGSVSRHSSGSAGAGLISGLVRLVLNTALGVQELNQKTDYNAKNLDLADKKLALLAQQNELKHDYTNAYILRNDLMANRNAIINYANKKEFNPHIKTNGIDANDPNDLKALFDRVYDKIKGKKYY